MTDGDANTSRSFRMNLARLWLGAAVAHGAFFALLVGVVRLAGREVDWVAVGCIAFVPAVFWVVYGLKFRVVVTAEGLHWVMLDGVDVFAQWGEITGATRQRYPGLTQVRVEVRDRGSSWVPLDLNDPAGFADALVEHAGPDHPLTRAVTGTSPPLHRPWLDPVNREKR
jgi:hypothetical protein